MMEWWRTNFTWIKWVLGVIWTAFVFGVGNYISYRETKAEVKSIRETLDVMYKVMDNVVKDNKTFKDYILFKER